MLRYDLSRTRFIASGLSTIALAGCGGAAGSTGASIPAPTPTPTASPAGTPASLSVSRAAPTTPLSSTFAGLSYEKSKLSSPLFAASNTPLVKLFELLGQSVLRIGGNSVDETTWTPGGAGGTSGQTAPSDVNALAGFLKAAGWQAIYGINLAQNTASVAAEEAAFVAKALGSSLYGFEIGNEPDLYKNNSAYPASLDTYAGYRSAWESFASAIQSAAPGVALTGPADAGDTTTYTIPFAQDEASRIVLLTQHYYRANGQNASSTIDLLLTPDPALPATVQKLVAAASANALRGFRMGECGSFYNGGAPNVSDAYGTALWALDYLFTLATAGAVGANFHGGGNGPGYTPIADSNGVVTQARPEFYGMLMFAQAASGKLGTTTIASAPTSFTAYTVARTDGNLGVVLVNKDGGTPVNATIALDRAATSMTSLALAGPNLSATTGMTLGGTAIGSDGSWSPVPSVAQAIAGRTLAVSIPAASALSLIVS